MKFETAVEIVLEHEGGYVYHPNDPGGETKYGISKKAYPDINIAELRKVDAKKIYKEDYWDAVKADSLPVELRLIVFDTAVNMGVGRSIAILQACLEVKLDGVIGPVTLNATKLYEPYMLLHKYALRRHNAYTNISNFEHFGAGWTKRLLDIVLKSFLTKEGFLRA